MFQIPARHSDILYEIPLERYVVMLIRFVNWQSRRQQPGKGPGFTGVELLAALSSALLVLLLSLPVYRLFADSETERLARSPSLALHLEFARQEAMREEATVTVCPTRDGRNCQTKGDWRTGWLIFIDEVSPPRHLSVGDTLLYRQRAGVGQQPAVVGMDLIRYQADGAILLN
jgi:type IV fimbrial biogenesis protein FimT